MTLTAILYARVSTDEQARSGYSLRQQMEALRAYCEREEIQVLEEVEDPGYSGAALERPGLDRVRDLVEGGGVSVVLAQDRDRIAREPAYHYLLREEFAEHGTSLRAMNDRGDDSPEGELSDGIIQQIAKYERAKFAERSRRNLDKKVKEGKIIRGNQHPYGFQYDEDGETLFVREPEMGVVRRIIHLVGVENKSLGEVQRTFKREGIPSAMGGGWPRSTVRYLLLNELYRPHSVSEVATCGLVSEQVVRTLQEDRVYGLWTWNKSSTKRWRTRNLDGGYDKRVKITPRPRDQWLAVPVDITDAGISREHLDKVREELGKNERRPASTRAKHFWQLSGGIARCAVCGNGFSPHTVSYKGKLRFYYRCYTRYNSGLEKCTNSRSMPAGPMEQAVWEFVLALLSDPKRLAKQYEEHIEREKRQMRGDPDKEASRLAAQIQKLDNRRSGYQDLAADGDMDREELREKLQDLKESREELGAALRQVQSRHQSIQQSLINWTQIDLIMDSMKLNESSAEDRRRLYTILRLHAYVDQDRSIRVSGIFDPGMYPPDVLQDPPEWLAPIPDTSKMFVSMDSADPYTL